MKKIINYFISIVFAVSTIGCSDLRFGDAFLEKAPGVDVTIDTIFSSKLYADRALVAAYSTLRVGFPIHNSAWPLGSTGLYDQGKRWDRACSQLDNDNLDAITDLMESHNDWSSGGQEYAAGNYSAESENGVSWTKLGFTPEKELNWSGIRRAFQYIENVDRVPDMTQQEKELGKAECYLIIASHYLDMFRHYGGIPLLKKSIEADNVQGEDFSRKTAEEVLGYILELCDKAMALPWTVSAEQDGKLTRAAAYALKCRALLFAASPLFNSAEPYSSQTPIAKNANATKVDAADIPKMYWFGGYDQTRWQEVVDACEDFFEENRKEGNIYGLVQPQGTTFEDYRRNWSTCYVDRYNQEIIIHTGRHYDTFANTYLRCYFGVSDDNGNNGRGYGGGCVTLNFIDLFQNLDGTPAKYADWVAANGNVSKVENDAFRNRDPRLYESVMINGDRFRDRCAEMWIGGLERGAALANRAITGFCSRKFMWDYNNETFMNRPLNYANLRMPEIYLTYAEALNEVGRKEEALEMLNVVRRRVGIADMTDELLALNHPDALPSYTGLIGDPKLREEILDERARELFFEECRWYDIVRWKRDDIFTKDLYGIEITIAEAVRTEDTNNDGVITDLDDIDPYASKFNYSNPKKEDDRYWKNHWDTKWYLSAFPTNEINKGYGLVQNPGW